MYAGCTIGESWECVNPWMYIDAFLLGFWSRAALSAEAAVRRPRASLPFQVRCRQSRPADSRNRAPCHRPLSPLKMQVEGDHASSSRRAGRYHHVDRPSRGTRCPASRNTAGRTGADAPAKIARLRSPIVLFSPIDFFGQSAHRSWCFGWIAGEPALARGMPRKWIRACRPHRRGARLRTRDQVIPPSTGGDAGQRRCQTENLGA